MKMIRMFALFAALGLGSASYCLAQASGAACPVTNLAIASYGEGCSQLALDAPVLSGIYDAPNCVLELNFTSTPNFVSADTSTQRIGRFLIVGSAAANTPASLPSPIACNILAQADLIVELGANAPDQLFVSVPPWVQPGVNVHLQGVNVFELAIFVTLTGCFVEMTNGLRLTTI